MTKMTNRFIENSSDYGVIIRDERMSQELTQKQLADLCEKDQSYISSVEKGNVNISTEIFMEIMGAMGIKVGITVNGIEVKTNEKTI